MKYTIKTRLDNIRKTKEGEFTYDEKIISFKFPAQEHFNKKEEENAIPDDKPKHR
tara:strand:- start:186 stop:350 length:165 start_codon:yes stop_codon:yes gene_type:complete